MTLMTTLLLILMVINYTTQQYSSSNEKYEKMLEWALENGLEIGDIELVYQNANDRYYIAKEDIPEGTKILSIPRKLFFNRNITMTKNLNKYKDKILNANLSLYKTELAKEQVFNAVHLLKLIKNPKSKIYKFFEPYFNFFPSDLSNFPLLYEPEELKILRFTFLNEIIKYSQTTMDEELKFLRDELNLNLNMEEYYFYRALSVSRSFNIEGINSMIPFTDLFIHNSKEFNIKWLYDIENQVLNIESVKNIKKGENIYMPNNPMSNHLSLFFYGYTEEGNNFLEDYQIDILHPYLRYEKNFTYTFYKQRMNLANDTFIDENLEIYELISKYYDYKQEKFAGYKLMLENLNYYAEDYDQIKESDFYTILINKKNRENIKRIIESEKNLLHSRIKQLKDYIKMLEDKDTTKEDL